MNTEEIILTIEKAIGIELYEWQKDYIFEKPKSIYPGGRQNGRTTAYMIKLILSKGDPIHLYKREALLSVLDDIPGEIYIMWFKHHLRMLYSLLMDTGLELRKIYFNWEESRNE